MAKGRLSTLSQRQSCHELLRDSGVAEADWPAPGSEDTELGVLMELAVDHGETARELNAALTCASLERRRLDDGASSPLVIHIFDAADEIADDLYLVDILIHDYDVREPIFDHDH
jgi:hypothetical protein